MANINRIMFVELFKTVGEKYSQDYLDKTGWMYSHQWTVQQRNDYTTWLASELEKFGGDRKKAEKDACHFVHKNGWQMSRKG
jgi:hypothetical protein